MAKLVTTKLRRTVEKISNVADLLLMEDGLQNFEIDGIVLSTKDGSSKFVDCNWVKQNGKWVKICKLRK